jgi:hypothetical protein
MSKKDENNSDQLSFSRTVVKGAAQIFGVDLSSVDVYDCSIGQLLSAKSALDKEIGRSHLVSSSDSASGSYKARSTIEFLEGVLSHVSEPSSSVSH